jgi:hypothetical protein
MFITSRTIGWRLGDRADQMALNIILSSIPKLINEWPLDNIQVAVGRLINNHPLEKMYKGCSADIHNCINTSWTTQHEMDALKQTSSTTKPYSFPWPDASHSPLRVLINCGSVKAPQCISLSQDKLKT